MLTTEIHEAAVEFGRAVRQAPAVSAYRAASDALEADTVAHGLMADLRERQTAVVRLHSADKAATQEQLEALRRCQGAVRANATIMAYLRATNDVKAFLPTVARQVSAALGTDYASLIAPTTC